MPAITVDDITVLPRIPDPDPIVARQRPVRSVTSAPSGLRGRGLPGPPRLRRRRPRRPRPVRPPRPDGRGGVRPGRAEGHAVAPAPRLRDRHLHDRRHLRAQRLERRRRRHHQRRHPVDDRRRRDPPHREAAGGARRERRAVPRLPALGEPAGGPEVVARRATRTSARARSRSSSSPDGGALVRVIAGEVAGHAGPGSTYTPMTLVHATLSPGARLALPWRADYNALVYVLAGRGHRRRRSGRPVRTGPARGLRPGRRAHRRRRADPGEPQPEPRRPHPRRPPDPRAGRLDGPVRDEHARGGHPGRSPTTRPAASAPSRPSTARRPR